MKYEQKAGRTKEITDQVDRQALQHGGVVKTDDVINHFSDLIHKVSGCKAPLKESSSGEYATGLTSAEISISVIFVRWRLISFEAILPVVFDRL